MRALALTGLVLAGLLVSSAPSAQASADSVRLAYDAYRRALLARDAEAVVRVVSPGTVSYYGAMVDAALDADSAAVAALRPTDLLMVLALRHRVPPDTVRAFDGAAALRYGVREGWVDGASVQLVEPGDVTVDGDTAVMIGVVGAEPVPRLRFSFVRSANGWGLDLGAAVRQADPDLAGMASERGTTVSGLVTSLLEAVTGRAVGPDAWQPLGR